MNRARLLLVLLAACEPSGSTPLAQMPTVGVTRVPARHVVEHPPQPEEPQPCKCLPPPPPPPCTCMPPEREPPPPPHHKKVKRRRAAAP